MSFIGNFFWFILGGIISGICWYLTGLLWCLTIIGIPIGKQCFKIGTLSFFPFGKKVVISDSTGSIILNILWIVISGWELAVIHLTSAVICACTIIGIPFAIQHLKLAKLALLPFGAEIVADR